MILRCPLIIVNFRPLLVITSSFFVFFSSSAFVAIFFESEALGVTISIFLSMVEPYQPFSFSFSFGSGYLQIVYKLRAIELECLVKNETRSEINWLCLRDFNCTRSLHMSYVAITLSICFIFV